MGGSIDRKRSGGAKEETLDLEVGDGRKNKRADTREAEPQSERANAKEFQFSLRILAFIFSGQQVYGLQSDLIRPNSFIKRVKWINCLKP